MDSLLRRYIKPVADMLNVQLRNFGDDIVFFGNDAVAVRACVAQAKKAFRKLGFKANEKCRDCEHRGERREFIGCATGREQPDYPRKKYLAFRKGRRLAGCIPKRVRVSASTSYHGKRTELVEDAESHYVTAAYIATTKATSCSTFSIAFAVPDRYLKPARSQPGS